jgi:hypothetical protein
VFLHDFARDRQSQTEAKGSAVLLGGEVGFEYAFAGFECLRGEIEGNLIGALIAGDFSWVFG